MLIGTIAHQTYAAMLGVRRSAGSRQTGDVDIASSRCLDGCRRLNTAVLDVLKEVDKSLVPFLTDLMAGA